jgi:hypothetical protein
MAASKALVNEVNGLSDLTIVKGVPRDGTDNDWHLLLT